MDSWLDFWNKPNAIYVNDRHREAHYTTVFAGISPFFPPGATSTVLDWGCGDALAADRMSQMCGTLLLFDAAESTRRRLYNRYASCPRIEVVDERQLEALPKTSIELVIVNSVVQYLSREQLMMALGLFHRLLKNDGKLLLGDIIEPHTPTVKHVTTFLRFAFKNNFFWAAALGLLQNFVSSYRVLRRNAGYACFTADELSVVLRGCGFDAERLPRNIAVSPHRSSYLARKSNSGSSAALRAEGTSS